MIALLAGYKKIMGGQIEHANRLACLGSQLCLESGNFQKGHKNNWGNKKLPADWDGEYCQFVCDEIFNKQMADLAERKGPCRVSLWKGGPNWRVVLLPPHPWSSFVAYETPEEGCADYVRFLSLRERYKAAWHASSTLGDPAAFSHELRRAGYYTADETTYTHGLVSIFGRLMPVCERLVSGQGHGVDMDLREQVESLVALTLAESQFVRCSQNDMDEEVA